MSDANSNGPYPRLLTPIRAGELNASNRVWMAPLTRSRARMPGNAPHALNATYYAQRAAGNGGAGVIISEATPVSPRGYGYYGTPWIVTDEQVAGWRQVTDAVHRAGGVIVCQLWHVGRLSHTSLQPGGGAPVGPTDVPSRSKTYIDPSMERVPTSVPRALRTEEVPEIVAEFRRGAQRAKEAGFDGVEIHGANTYILDQFTRDGMNTRTDAYGGSLENRLRLPLDVAAAVCEVWGPGRVGYRISPLSEHHDARDSDPARTFGTLAARLGEMGLAYLHAVETWDRTKPDPRTETVIPTIVEAFKRGSGTGPTGAYIANGDYSPAQAEHALAEGWCDAVAFGKLFISNPDLSRRIERGGLDARLEAPNPATFYGGGAEGYTDYAPLPA